jgi:hypothetical protein
MKDWFCRYYIILKPPLLQIQISSSREADRIAIKLKVMSGTYVLQSNRANTMINKYKVDPTCGQDVEDIEHFVLNCCLLENAYIISLTQYWTVYDNS